MEDTAIATGMHHQIETDEPLSQRVIAAVADAEGVDSLELDAPLFDVVDPDALDALFRPTVTAGDIPQQSIRFSYHGYRVTITDGDVSITEQ